jgi:prevent-host-death family protein
MKIAPVAEIKSKFSEYISDSHRETIVITKNGRPTAIMLGVNDDDDLESIIISNSKLIKTKIDNSVAVMKSGRRVSHTKFWKSAGL